MKSNQPWVTHGNELSQCDLLSYVSSVKIASLYTRAQFKSVAAPVNLEEIN